jgi:hypothetical protein
MNQLKAVLSTGMISVASLAIAYPANAQPVPQASLNACIQRTAEAMVVATRDIQMTSAGPVDAGKGTRTLFMRNTVTGQTAECKVNTIDAFVLDVRLTSQNPRPPQALPPAAINACTVRVAEEFVVATRNIDLLSAGPVSPESGAVTLNMRNSITGQTATCRVNTVTNTVLSVQLGGQTAPPPAQGRPVPPTDPMARNCQASVGGKIRRSFGGVKQINFLSDTTRAYPISNSQEGIRGEGEFRQGGPNWTKFNYNCTVNRRTGNVERSNFNLMR